MTESKKSNVIRLEFSDLIDARDLDLGTSDWLNIDQDRIDGFADVTEDHQWLHVDPVRAANGPFGTTIAHGYLTLSLVPRMLAEIFTVTDEVRGLNYGFEKARFTAPVPIGSQIRLAARLSRAQLRGDGGVAYHVLCTVEIREVSRPALVCELVFVSYTADPNLDGYRPA